MWTAPDDKYWSGLSSQLLENLNTPDDIKCFWRISYVPQVMMSKVRTWEILEDKKVLWLCDRTEGQRQGQCNMCPLQGMMPGSGGWGGRVTGHYCHKSWSRGGGWRSFSSPLTIILTLSRSGRIIMEEEPEGGVGRVVVRRQIGKWVSVMNC